MTADAERALGRPPTSLRAFAADYRETWISGRDGRSRDRCDDR
ncbi:hypothetical protein [Halegenticoccus soli]|nr:hypothetical protein [Halegenticoccus soli]